MKNVIVDVHAHTFPKHIAPRAIALLEERCAPFGLKACGSGTTDGLLSDMRVRAVDYAVICPVATKPTQFDVLFEQALATREGSLGDEAATHFIPFMSVMPTDPQAIARLTRVANAGLRGIKIHPYYQQFILDDAAHHKFFEACRDLNLIVQCHCGRDLGFNPTPCCSPKNILALLRAVPGLTFIAAHLGGWSGAGDQKADCLLDTDAFFDTAVLVCDFSNAEPARILQTFPTDRLLFGTDWPWAGYPELMDYIDRVSGWTPAQRAAVMGGNAARLLNLSE